jgi:2',3'-cyclic-nucleotide 2'-phosphodiesterase/3'-nucleotidase/5'-nucleotidase
MRTGWIPTGGKWYYLYEDGAMAHDTIIDNKYTVGSDGAWIQ